MPVAAELPYITKVIFTVLASSKEKILVRYISLKLRVFNLSPLMLV
jgi:hypothetical protein